MRGGKDKLLHGDCVDDVERLDDKKGVAPVKEARRLAVVVGEGVADVVHDAVQVSAVLCWVFLLFHEDVVVGVLLILIDCFLLVAVFVEL